MQELADQMQADALEAQKFTRKHLVLELDFTLECLEDLESHVDAVDYALAGGKSAANIELLTRLWGSYLGELLRRHVGGEWIRENAESGPRIALQSSHGLLYPHEQVRLRLTEGPQYSLPSYFQQMCDRL